MHGKQAETDVQILRKVGNARNLLAHIGKVGIAGEKAGYLHPQKPGEVINSADVEVKFKNLEADCVKAEEFLLGWVMKLSPYQRALRGETTAGAETKDQTDGKEDT